VEHRIERHRSAGVEAPRIALTALIGGVLIGASLPGAPASRGVEPERSTAQGRSPWAEIWVVDPATGRGVPLVELETVNRLRFVTDDLGRLAFQEPGLMGREISFHVRSHGHEFPADGFGLRGRKIVPRAGEAVVIELPRTTLAERVCRLTGEGRLRDSILLGHLPLPDDPLPGGVARQDSVRPAGRSRSAAAEASASVSRSTRAEPQAQAGRDGTRDRQRRQATRGHGQRACA